MIKLQLLLAAICLAEAWLERYVIAMKGKHYAKYDRQEHIWSAVLYVVIVLSLWYVDGDINNWPILLAALPIRFLFMTYFLNVIRVEKPKPFFYLGDDGVDGFLDKILGNLSGVIAFVFCLGALLLINLLI